MYCLTPLNLSSNLHHLYRQFVFVCALCGRTVAPPSGPEQPLWIQELWLGPKGSQHGEQGLMRSAARKFARPIGNALSMASQTCKERDFANVPGSSSWRPSVVIEGRVTRRVGALTNEDGEANLRFADMYVHDAVFGNKNRNAIGCI